MVMAEKIKLFLLGVIVALLAVAVFGNHKTPDLSSLGLPAAVASDTASGDGVLAVASGDNLFLINTATKNLAFYSYKSSKFSLRAGRYYKYDLGLVDELRDGGISVKDAKKAADDGAKELRKLDE